MDGPLVCVWEIGPDADGVSMLWRLRTNLLHRVYEIAKRRVEYSYLKITFGDWIIGRAIIYLKEDADVYDGQEQLG